MKTDAQEKHELNKQVLIRLLSMTKVTGYKVDCKRYFGSPDIAFPKEKLAVVIYDCEMHQCYSCIQKGTVMPVRFITDEFYAKEIEKTIREDEKYENKFADSKDWGLLTVWDCQLADTPLRVLNSIRSYLLLPVLKGEEEEKISSLRVR